MSNRKSYDEQAREVTMSGYRRHEPDLIDDPHHWTALLGNPYEVLCEICGQIETQDGGLPVWKTVREGKQ